MGKHILCVGLVCVDYIFEVPSFPKEDSDIRCLSHWVERGGNASNNCTTLSTLGAHPVFLGTIADGKERSFIEEDFKEYGIDFSHAPLQENCRCPISSIFLSAANGSRTIVHSNSNLKEITMEDFSAINLQDFCWVHFEGRNVTVVKRMIETVRDLNLKLSNKIVTSVEIEKPSVDIEELVSLADYVFVSKDYALSRELNSIESTLTHLCNKASPSSTVICPWGDRGAGAKTGPDGSIILSPSFPPTVVRNTLGAGDTFIGSTIFALLRGKTIQDAITFGSKVAGYRIGFRKWSEFRLQFRNQDMLDNFLLL